MLCFYHSDLDGHCSGAIIKYRFPNCRMIEMDYRKEFPIDEIEFHEQVFIVDFSLQKPGDWERLFSMTKNVVWIDHHVTAIKGHPELAGLEGLRDVTEQKAGCLLTWEYLYPGEEIPWSIKYISDRDVWKWEYPDTENFCAGMDNMGNAPDSKIWEKLFSNDASLFEKVIKEDGAVITHYRKKDSEERMSYAFDVKFEGYNCKALNQGHTSSKVFDSLKKPYDIYICFIYDGKVWTMSLYSQTVNVGEIAKKYGGGGHAHASGFNCKTLPF